MAGADKADGADGIVLQVFAQTLIEREEWRLHGFHEEAVVRACGGEDTAQLANVEGGWLFAEDVFTGGEGLEAEVGMGVGMGGDVDGVDVGGEQGVERGRDCGNGESLA